MLILLRYLQMLLGRGLSVTTIKMYAAALPAQHALESRFLKSVLPLLPSHAVRAPSWDLYVVLEPLCSPLFKPLEHADLTWLVLRNCPSD